MRLLNNDGSNLAELKCKPVTFCRRTAQKVVLNLPNILRVIALNPEVKGGAFQPNEGSGKATELAFQPNEGSGKAVSYTHLTLPTKRIV